MDEDKAAAGSGSTANNEPEVLLTGEEFVVPEKFVVKKEDGSLDWESVAKKSIGSFLWAEKKIGQEGQAPASESEYKLDYSKLGENFKIEAEQEKKMLKHFHGKGWSNKRLQEVFDYFGDIYGEGLKLHDEKTKEASKAVVTELREEWGDSAELHKSNINAAFDALADDRMRQDKGKIGHDLQATYRALLVVMARVGADYLEDTPVKAEAFAEETIESLQRSKAYWDPKDPEHAAAVRKVKEHYDKKYRAK